MEAGLPADAQKEIHRLVTAVARDVGLPLPVYRTLPGSLHATLKDGVLLVPEQHVNHWRRFGVLPSALVRDVAYAFKRAQLVAHGGLSGATIEADAMAYAERFLRAATESDEDA